MKEMMKLLILCVVLISAVERLPVAAKGNPLTFNIEGATKESYNQFIEQLRTRVRGGDMHSIPRLADPSEVADSNRYVTVQLSSATQSVTIGIDVTNLYVVAYQVGSVRYFLSNIPDSAATYLFTDAQSTYPLPFGGSYTELERWAGQGRARINLGLESLRDAISNLHPDNDSKRARALIVIIQMVSEAARYRIISHRIGERIESHSGSPPDATMLSLEKNWDSLSTAVQESEQGTFRNAVSIVRRSGGTIQVENLRDIISVIAMMLFVCKQNPKVSPLLLRSMVELSETCDVFEPKVRISGRDGMCMHVSSYNDGNPIVIQKCKEKLEQDQLWTLKLDKTFRSKDKCLTAYGFKAGEYMMIYDCETAVRKATYWEFQEDGTIVNPESSLVLSAENGAVGATLTVEKDEHRMRQTWKTGNDTSPTVTSISGYKGLCMEAHGDNVWVSTCNDKDAQQWALYPDGSIRPKQSTGKCLTSERHEKGATIVLMGCSNAWASQRWVFRSDGTIYSLFDKMVMDVKLSDPSLKRIILWTPTGNDNQKWLILF